MLSWAVWLQSGDRGTPVGETSQGQIPEGDEHQVMCLDVDFEVAVEGFQAGQ